MNLSQLSQLSRLSEADVLPPLSAVAAADLLSQPTKPSAYPSPTSPSPHLFQKAVTGAKHCSTVSSVSGTKADDCWFQMDAVMSKDSSHTTIHPLREAGESAQIQPGGEDSLLHTHDGPTSKPEVAGLTKAAQADDDDDLLSLYSFLEEDPYSASFVSSDDHELFEVGSIDTHAELQDLSEDELEELLTVDNTAGPTDTASFSVGEFSSGVRLEEEPEDEDEDFDPTQGTSMDDAPLFDGLYESLETVPARSPDDFHDPAETDSEIGDIVLVCPGPQPSDLLEHPSSSTSLCLLPIPDAPVQMPCVILEYDRSFYSLFSPFPDHPEADVLFESSACSAWSWNVERLGGELAGVFGIHADVVVEFPTLELSFSPRSPGCMSMRLGELVRIHTALRADSGVPLKMLLLKCRNAFEEQWEFLKALVETRKRTRSEVDDDAYDEEEELSFSDEADARSGVSKASKAPRVEWRLSPACSELERRPHNAIVTC